MTSVDLVWSHQMMLHLLTHVSKVASSGLEGWDHMRSDSLGMSLIVSLLIPGQCVWTLLFRYDSTLCWKNSEVSRRCFNSLDEGVLCIHSNIWRWRVAQFWDSTTLMYAWTLPRRPPLAQTQCALISTPSNFSNIVLTRKLKNWAAAYGSWAKFSIQCVTFGPDVLSNLSRLISSLQKTCVMGLCKSLGFMVNHKLGGPNLIHWLHILLQIDAWDWFVPSTLPAVTFKCFINLWTLGSVIGFFCRSSSAASFKLLRVTRLRESRSASKSLQVICIHADWRHSCFW